VLDAPPLLIGRQAELRGVVSVLERAAGDRAASLVVRGEPGIGKTALLRAAASEAEVRGMQVVRARGVEAEADLPFAGLTGLLAPLLDLRQELTPAHVAALEGALALGPPSAQPPFAVAAATAGLLALAAERQPVAVIVDDAHWIDEESLQAIVFAARRLGRDPIAFVVATRPVAGGAPIAAGLDELELSRLAVADAGALLDRVAPSPLGETVRSELTAAAAGNPLALVELPRGLTADQLSGTRPLPDPIRPGASVEASFHAQLAAVPPATRLALTAIAAERDLDPGVLEAALDALGVGSPDVAAAVAAGLVAEEAGTPELRHPLVRAAAYHGASPADRRRVHLALADAHAARGEHSRAGWHRAAAATGPDPEVAALLDHAGDEARARGALSLAAQAAQRAAELTADPAERTRRLLTAVRDLARTAHPERAAELAAQATADCDDPLLRADLQRVRGEVLIRLGAFEPAVELLLSEADRVAPIDPVRAARMLLSASVRYRASGAYADMRAVAERARELAGEAQPDVALLADVVLAHVLVITGQRAAGDELIGRREHDLATLPAGATPELLTSPAHASLWVERPDRSERIVDALIAAGRARSAPAELAFPLGIRTQLRFRQGRWREALADGGEAVELATDTGQLALVAFAGGALAEVEAATGREDDCRDHVERALAIADPTHSDAIGIYAHAALGLLELGLGRLDVAVEELSWCRAAAERMGMVEASVAHWAGSLVDGLGRTGARDALSALVGELDAVAAATGGRYAAGCAARGRGLLAGDDFAAPLASSIEQFEHAGLPFEAARSQLALGELLRRARRRRDSRPPLVAAHAAFERLGARPWAERALAELQASGAAPAVAAPERVGELTAAELRVALLAAAGRTNPEIATELFVSRRTVEHQLSSVYRKLDLRTRAELPRALRG
jgi:DNA-binding CsgD family transcriptional regulator/tetratricopeptide (TPR) repeat protein